MRWLPSCMLTIVLYAGLSAPCFVYGAEPVQQPAQREDAQALAGLVDDSAPGVLRVGSVQIAWGVAAVPCQSPANVCQIAVRFVKPFAEPPVVSFTNVSDYNTQKQAFTSVYLNRLRPDSFTARVMLQANIGPLKRIPWMAVGYWR